jgi:hypothetical protein
MPFTGTGASHLLDAIKTEEHYMLDFTEIQTFTSDIAYFETELSRLCTVSPFSQVVNALHETRTTELKRLAGIRGGLFFMFSNGIFELACEKGNLSAVKILATRGYDINRDGHYGYNESSSLPIMLAIENGHFLIADYLVSRGVDMSYPIAFYHEYALDKAGNDCSDESAAYIEAYLLNGLINNDDHPDKLIKF